MRKLEFAFGPIPCLAIRRLRAGQGDGGAVRALE